MIWRHGDGDEMHLSWIGISGPDCYGCGAVKIEKFLIRVRFVSPITNTLVVRRNRGYDSCIFRDTVQNVSGSAM